MNWKKIGKRTGIVIGSLALLALIVNIGVNLLVRNKLPKIIEEKNDSAYQFDYESLGFSILDGSLYVKNVKVMPKKNANIRKDINFYGTVGEISVTGVNFVELLRHKNLKAFTIYVDQPNITVLKQEKDTLKNQSTIANSIDIDKITVRKANIRMMSQAGDTLLQEVHNFNVQVDGVHMGKYTKGKNIPFTYQDYNFKIDSVYSKMNDFQFIKTGAITIDKENFNMNDFRIYPNLTSNEFKNKETNSNTRLNLEVPLLNLKETDWGYNQDDQFYVNVGKINIDSIRFNILDQKKQTVFQQAHRDAEHIVQPLIPFRIDVGEINIKKSSFKSLGILDVKNVNISIKKISNRVHEHLTIDEFNLNKPLFVHVPKPSSGEHRKNNEPSQLNDIILINKININDAQYELKDATGKRTQLTVNNFNLTLNKIRIDDKTVKEKVPFLYENPLLTTGKIHYNTGDNYDIYTNGIVIKENNVLVKNIEMKPKKSRAAFNKSLKYGQDHYTIHSGAIQFNGMNWGFNANDMFFLKFKEVVLNNVNANIYRDATIPNNPKENALYSKKLRELKIGLDINNLRIVNSKIEYEEVAENSKAPGKLTFSNFNLNANNIYSGAGKSSGPTTQIHVKTSFMNSASLAANWSFNIMNRSDAFNINGEINNFPAPGMNPFIKPYMNASAAGTIDKMQFDFNGNNNTSVGKFGMQYHDMKLTLYKKDGVKERKLLSKVGNWFIKNDTKGEVVTTEIKPVDRKKDSSFFNFLWLSVLQGLKQTLL